MRFLGKPRRFGRVKSVKNNYSAKPLTMVLRAVILLAMVSIAPVRTCHVASTEWQLALLYKQYRLPMRRVTSH